MSCILLAIMLQPKKKLLDQVRDKLRPQKYAFRNVMIPNRHSIYPKIIWVWMFFGAKRRKTSTSPEFSDKL